MLTSAAAQQLIGRVGLRTVAVVGMAIVAVGMLVLARLPVHGGYGDLLAGLVPLAIGFGLAFVPLTVMATSGVGDQDAGLAGGLYNVAQQVGGSLGLAIMSTLAASRTSSLLTAGATHPLTARVSGYHVAFWPPR